MSVMKEKASIHSSGIDSQDTSGRYLYSFGSSLICMNEDVDERLFSSHLYFEKDPEDPAEMLFLQKHQD